MIVDMNGDGVITEEEKVKALHVASLKDSNPLKNIFDEYSTMSNTDDRTAEQLVIRERMMEATQLPQTFSVEDYFAQVFGANL